jgi:ApaG protein
MMNQVQTGHSDTLTEGIRVRVAAEFIDQGEDRDGPVWLYAYRVIISNEGPSPVTLRRRHWLIRDAEGRLEEVEGPGVIGEEPHLLPGDEHEYNSACPLKTHWGTMEGSYTMEREDGSRFKAIVGRFFLAETTAPMAELDPE